MEYEELLQLAKDFWNSPYGKEAINKSREREAWATELITN